MMAGHGRRLVVQRRGRRSGRSGRSGRRFRTVVHSQTRELPAQISHSLRLRSSAFARTDYNNLIRDAQAATRAAIQDGHQLLEVEFPVASLTAVQGDEEGANEMTRSSEYLRQFARMFLDEADKTRVFFPDVKEAKLQSEGVWSDFSSIHLDYLTKPSGLLDIGIDLSGYDPAGKIRPEERVFISAYPSFDPRELVATDKVWKHIQGSKDADGKTLVIFNAELCRLRSDYFPALFYPEMARLSKEMIPVIETVYYVHNFKGVGSGVLFRAYPGPWEVYLRLSDGTMVLVHEQEDRPTLKEVSLEILPRSIRTFSQKR